MNILPMNILRLCDPQIFFPPPLVKTLNFNEIYEKTIILELSLDVEQCLNSFQENIKFF